MRNVRGTNVVLLGASNLTRGLAAVLAAARAVLGGPLEVLAAIGHGRSYGMWSRVLGRGLPGIASCGAWEALAAVPPAPVHALVTDVGNDILYGAPPEAIAGWVEACLERLAASGARTVLTLLPLETCGAIGPTRFEVARRILFPRHRGSRAEVLARAREVDARLREAAARHGTGIIEPQREWYSIDPIHIPYRRMPVVWAEVLARWRPGEPPPRPAPPSFRSWLGLRGLRAERWTRFGIERRTDQPCRMLPDGTAISLY